MEQRPVATFDLEQGRSQTPIPRTSMRASRGSRITGHSTELNPNLPPSAFPTLDIAVPISPPTAVLEHVSSRPDEVATERTEQPTGSLDHIAGDDGKGKHSILVPRAEDLPDNLTRSTVAFTVKNGLKVAPRTRRDSSGSAQLPTVLELLTIKFGEDPDVNNWRFRFTPLEGPPMQSYQQIGEKDILSEGQTPTRSHQQILGKHIYAEDARSSALTTCQMWQALHYTSQTAEKIQLHTLHPSLQMAIITALEERSPEGKAPDDRYYTTLYPASKLLDEVEPEISGFQMIIYPLLVSKGELTNPTDEQILRAKAFLLQQDLPFGLLGPWIPSPPPSEGEVDEQAFAAEQERARYRLKEMSRRATSAFPRLSRLRRPVYRRPPGLPTRVSSRRTATTERRSASEVQHGRAESPPLMEQGYKKRKNPSVDGNFELVLQGPKKRPNKKRGSTLKYEVVIKSEDDQTDDDRAVTRESIDPHYEESASLTHTTNGPFTNTKSKQPSRSQQSPSLDHSETVTLEQASSTQALQPRKKTGFKKQSGLTALLKTPRGNYLKQASSTQALQPRKKTGFKKRSGHTAHLNTPRGNHSLALAASQAPESQPPKRQTSANKKSKFSKQIKEMEDLLNLVEAALAAKDTSSESESSTPEPKPAKKAAGSPSAVAAAATPSEEDSDSLPQPATRRAHLKRKRAREAEEADPEGGEGGDEDVPADEGAASPSASEAESRAFQANARRLLPPPTGPAKRRYVQRMPGMQSRAFLPKAGRLVALSGRESVAAEKGGVRKGPVIRLPVSLIRLAEEREQAAAAAAALATESRLDDAV